jgi:hypothetical protein
MRFLTANGLLRGRETTCCQLMVYYAQPLIPVAEPKILLWQGIRLPMSN